MRCRYASDTTYHGSETSVEPTERAREFVDGVWTGTYVDDRERSVRSSRTSDPALRHRGHGDAPGRHPDDGPSRRTRDHQPSRRPASPSRCPRCSPPTPLGRPSPSPLSVPAGRGSQSAGRCRPVQAHPRVLHRRQRRQRRQGQRAPRRPRRIRRRGPARRLPTSASPPSPARRPSPRVSRGTASARLPASVRGRRRAPRPRPPAVPG